MKRWALLTIVLYLVALAALAVPAVMEADILSAPLNAPPAMMPAPSLSPFLSAYKEGLYWIGIGAFALIQALMLVVPVKAAQEMTLKKRHILVPIVTAGFLMMLLIATGAFSIIIVVFGEGAAPVDKYPWSFAAFLPGLWIFWGYVFRRYSLTLENPADWMKRITTALYKGSIAELVVAVGCHIAVRRRGDCCSPVITAFGIASGLAVMLLSFGPGVFYLFAERRKRMLSKKQKEAAAIKDDQPAEPMQVK